MGAPKRRRVRLLIALAVVLAVALVVYLGTWSVRVTVTNKGPAALKDVTVKVTGNSYAIGDVPVGEARTVRVDPTGDSHVEIDFSTGKGQLTRLFAGVSIGPGFRGTMEIDVKDGKIEQLRDRTGRY